MKVYELMEQLAKMEAGANVAISGEQLSSESLEVLYTTADTLDFGVTIWVDGTTQIGGEEFR